LLSRQGAGNIIEKNTVVGSGTISHLTQIQNNEYAESLKQFSENVNSTLKGQQISEKKIKSINESIIELAKEVKDIKPGLEEQIDYAKQITVEAKTASVIQKVLDVSPQAAATFTPLSPFSKLIGKGIQEILDSTRIRLNKDQ
jgi:hypothetical protein